MAESRARQIEHWRHPGPHAIGRVAEAVGWSLLVRGLLAAGSLDRALGVLDALPRRRPERINGGLPPERPFRLAGQCLGRSLARSQYLRIRGRPHALVIGVRGGLHAFAAHAWLEGDPVEPDFTAVRTVRR